jgi:hypothetical protein
MGTNTLKEARASPYNAQPEGIAGADMKTRAEMGNVRIVIDFLVGMGYPQR